MALVVFLRGVNIGGHRTFRPSVVAKTLRAFDVVNIGAAGTFVVRKPGKRDDFRKALVRALPFETLVVVCEGRDLLRIESENPFRDEPARPDVVRFVSILSRSKGVRATLPVAFPSNDDWLVRVIAADGRFVFGEYRRHMRTITWLGKIDDLFAVPATTRSWTTIATICRILRGSA